MPQPATPDLGLNAADPTTESVAPVAEPLNVQMLATAGIFFGLGFVIAYLVFGMGAATPGPAGLQQAVEQTLVALTPPPTPLPTRVPTQLTYAAHNPRLGPADAPITIVEFSDYQCPFCNRFHAETLQPLLDHYGDLVRFIYRDYPVIGGQSSLKASVAAQCAHQQGQYWEYSALIWQNQGSPAPRPLDSDLLASFAQSVGLDLNSYAECVAGEQARTLVMLDYSAGQAFAISGTPTFFIEGTRLVGAQPLSVFIGVIDAELKRLGIAPPGGFSRN